MVAADGSWEPLTARLEWFATERAIMALELGHGLVDGEVFSGTVNPSIGQMFIVNS